MPSEPEKTIALSKVLSRYNRKALKLFACSYHSMELACKALLHRDSKLAKQVVSDHYDIDSLNDEMNFVGMSIMANCRPVGDDLKFVVCMMRLCGLVKRLSDNAVGISKHTLRLNRMTEIREARLLEPLFNAVLKHAHHVRKAFENRDYDKIKECRGKEAGKGSQPHALTNRLARASEDENTSIAALAELILISRLIEHIRFELGRIEEEILGLA